MEAARDRGSRGDQASPNGEGLNTGASVGTDKGFKETDGQSDHHSQIPELSLFQKLNPDNISARYRERYFLELEKALSPYDMVHEEVESEISQDKAQPSSEVESSQNTEVQRPGTFRRVWQMCTSAAPVETAAKMGARIIETASGIGAAFAGGLFFEALTNTAGSDVVSEQLLHSGLGMVALGAIAFTHPLSNWLQQKFQVKMERHVQGEVYNAVDNFTQEDLDSRGGHTKVTLLREQAWRIPRYASSTVDIHAQAIGVGMATLAIANGSPTLAAAVALCAIPRFFTEKRNTEATTKVEEMLAPVQKSYAIQSWQTLEKRGVAELKQHGRLAEFHDEALETYDDIQNPRLKLAGWHTLDQYKDLGISRLTTLGGGVYVTAQVIAGAMEPSVGIFLMGALASADASFAGLTKSFGLRSTDGQLTRKALDVIEASEESRRKDEARRTNDLKQLESPPEIALEGVSYSPKAGEPAILSDIDLTIYPGEFVTIVGESGSGKTTLTKILEGVYQPSTGAVTFDEVDISTVKREQLNTLISTMPANVDLFVARSVRKNIDLGKPKLGEGMPIERTLELAVIDETILERGLDATVGCEWGGGTEFSDGEKQRVLAARAFRKDAQVLTMDEPTSRLDPGLAKELTENIEQHYGAGKTRIMVTHNVLAAAEADRIVVMEKGRARIGTFSELMDPESGNAWFQDVYTGELEKSKVVVEKNRRRLE
jgi:ABC-type multidrug transport system fused ATPase/permease subunit